MNNPGVQQEIWATLRQKWSTLLAEGHSLKVEFNVLKDPADASRALAIDVVQNIDGEFHVQTVQNEKQQAYSAIGIDGFSLDQLINLAGRAVNSVTKSITGRETYDDEMHIFMKLISPETAEIYGHVISKTGEKIGIQSNYQHYYVLNEIAEQISEIMKEKYAEIQLHRNKGDLGRVYLRFLHAN
jgi:hypothetical protein